MLFKRAYSLAGLGGLALVGGVLGKIETFLGYVQLSDNLDIDKTEWGKYTHINLAFGIPQEDGSITFEQNKTLEKAVSKIHESNAKAIMSLGGYAGSMHFSTLVADEERAKTFREKTFEMMEKYKLDGADFDWEFPGRNACSLNKVDEAADTSKFASFLDTFKKEMTAKFGEGQKLMTAAVRVEPFDEGGKPMKDVKQFAEVFDYILVMAYDINGGWLNVSGPNAPMRFETGKGAQFSLETAIGNWTEAGFPANKLLAGMPYYCRSSTLSAEPEPATNQYQPQSSDPPMGDREDRVAVDPCAGESAKNASSGVWRYKHLREAAEGDPRGQVLREAEVPGDGWEYQYQDPTQTVTMLHRQDKIIMSCDNPRSLKAKAQFAKEKGLRGVGIWSLEMDFNNELADAIIEGWG
ncbi:hypothetical protein CDD83_6355 [Cordyceps sp. RAO-2017]|nr:hypothetical protein CDD83_6355 [Cordyceps sp. RAO-2017]